MTEALFGLAGVLIGGLLSVVTNIFLERRRDNIAAKVGARLVRDDLYKIAIYLENAIIAKAWVDNDIDIIEIESWEDQRPHLAKALVYSDYGKIVSAMHVIGKINHYRRSNDKRLPIDDEALKQFNLWLDDIREGLQALLSVAKD